MPLLLLGIAQITTQPQASGMPAPAAALRAHREAYHGWPDAIVLGNGLVEAVIVPAVGRVMQIRLAGESDGPLWENRGLDGRSPNPVPQLYCWDNFGGDKTWPAPQDDWPQIMSRTWPPPAAFDSMAVQAEITTAGVTLVSPVDADYGIRATRRVSLEPGHPVMRITATFEKVQGEPVTVSVWTVTQLRHPQLVATPLAKTPAFPDGFTIQIGQQPPGLKSQEGLLSMRCSPEETYKVGMESATLLWLGEKWTVRIDSPRLPTAKYPDGGCSAEICSSPEPDPYVEMEMLGPLRTLKVGEQTSQTTTYSLQKRCNKDPEAEARCLLVK